MLSQTSLEVYAREVKPSLNYKQKLVLEALEEIAPANNKQLAEHLKWPINSITPRVLELRTKGSVIHAFIAKDTQGRNSNYWKPKNAPREFPDLG